MSQFEREVPFVGTRQSAGMTATGYNCRGSSDTRGAGGKSGGKLGMQGDEEDGVTVGPVEARRVVLCVYAPFPTQSPVSWRSAGNCDIKEDAAGRREHFRRQLRKSFVVVVSSSLLSFSFPFLRFLV